MGDAPLASNAASTDSAKSAKRSISTMGRNPASFMVRGLGGTSTPRRLLMPANAASSRCLAARFRAARFAAVAMRAPFSLGRHHGIGTAYPVGTSYVLSAISATTAPTRFHAPNPARRNHCDS